jgi:hypothetical protein
MICYAHEKEQGKLWAYFEDTIRRYRLGRTGDRFLVAILDMEKEEFIFDLFIKP